jgi:glycosyltransferase involved in cell wall biosynthesis
MKIAIIHDYLNQYGGAERVVEALHDVFPEAPIYTSIYLPQNMPESFRKMDIRPSFMQRLPFLAKHFKKYLLLYPKAIESFDLAQYEIVISSSSAFAKAAIAAPMASHICYCHTPMRFVWDYQNYIGKEALGFLMRSILPFAIHKLKRWDVETVERVNHYIANSENIQNKIREVYQRSAVVIYPPVRTAQYYPSEKVEDYFLVVSRLNAYKRIDIVIEAFNQLGLPLKIVGSGPQETLLKRMAKRNVLFLGKVPEAELVELYRHCQAFIFPGAEDFGIAPVEAQAAGRPVLAYKAGGALETVVDGVTGLLFDKQSPEAIVEIVTQFKRVEWNSSSIRENALRFDEKIFKSRMRAFVFEKQEERQSKRH